MEVTSADPELARTWRRAKRARRLSLAIQWLVWLVSIPFILFEGEPSSPPETFGRLDRTARRSTIRGGSRVLAGGFLVLPQTTAWPGSRQVGVQSKPTGRWWGGAGWIGGVIQVDELGLRWVPSALWADAARDFLVSWDEVRGVHTNPGRHIDGITVDVRTGGQVWFAARSADLALTKPWGSGVRPR